MKVLLISHHCRHGEPFDDLAAEASALRESGDLKVTVAPWYDLEIDDATGIGLRDERFDAVLSFAFQDPVEIDTTAPAAEQAALQRLERLGAGTRRLNVVLNAVRFAASRGQITNAERGEMVFDNKATFAQILAMSDTNGGPPVRRPRTAVCRTADLDRAENCLLKLAGAARGEGILMPGERPVDPNPDDVWIAQELLADPWLVDGHKADVRVYVVVDTQSREKSVVTEAALLRLAARPYQRGVLESEVTSATYRVRNQLPLATYPLDHPDVKRAVEQSAQQFLDLYFWFTRTCCPPDATPRILLFGLDCFVQQTADGFTGWLLEANLYPYLFQFPAVCHPTIRKLLADPYAHTLAGMQ